MRFLVLCAEGTAAPRPPVERDSKISQSTQKRLGRRPTTKIGVEKIPEKIEASDGKIKKCDQAAIFRKNIFRDFGTVLGW